MAPPPTLPTPVCSTVAPVVDDESPRSPTFAEQIALAADELQSPRSPTFEEQITECRRTLKPTPPSPSEDPTGLSRGPNRVESQVGSRVERFPIVCSA